MFDASIDFAGLSLQNPIAVASGICGFGREYAEYFDWNSIGAICAKGLTLAPREGNSPPRIAETPMGMLNSVGLQNPGVDAFLREELPFLKQFEHLKIIANIAGNTVEEYAEMAARLGNAVDMLEVNISCPNVKHGGMAFGTDPKSAAAVTSAVKAAAKVPVMVKLSPNVTDITEIARAAESAGADALSLINTVNGMRIDVNTRKPVLSMGTGGLSGAAVLPVAVRCIWQVRRVTRLPILGMGGVYSGADAAELMLAGANAVALGSVLFSDPNAPLRVLGELESYASSQGVDSFGALCGFMA